MGVLNEFTMLLFNEKGAREEKEVKVHDWAVDEEREGDGNSFVEVGWADIWIEGHGRKEYTVWGLDNEFEEDYVCLPEWVGEHDEDPLQELFLRNLID